MLTNDEIAAVLARPTTDVVTAGKVLGLGYVSSYRLAKTGEIPAIRMGRKWVVPTAKLRELLGMPAAA